MGQDAEIMRWIIFGDVLVRESGILGHKINKV